MLHAALTRRTLAFGTRERRVLARVLENFEAAALALVLVEVAAPHGRAARGDAFAAIADELQALRQTESECRIRSEGGGLQVGGG